jgi:gliding motility associated protien GldN
MKKVGLILACVSLYVVSFAQTYESTGTEGNTNDSVSNVMAPIRAPIDGVYKKVHLSKFDPVPLQHIREADVLYSKLTWSVIDLREKINHPLYFPMETKGNWKSLMQTIFDITTDTSETNQYAIMVYDDEYLSIPYTREGLRGTLGTTRIEPELNDFGEEIGQKIIFIPRRASEVFKYIVKDQYILDKQRSVMEPRIMGICPMFWYENLNEASSVQEEEAYDDDMPAVPLRRWRAYGWMFYDELRPAFAVTEVFNPGNNAQRRTYDDIFLMRHFDSYFQGVENVHNNRQINEYILNGMDQRLEADAFKEEIRIREHDMWEY